jgi:pimeloyl-ACP methyl ester carboxylesterase
VVQVGYRGVDGTPKLDCPEVTAAIKGVGNNLLSTESLDHLGEAVEGCSNRLQAEGVDLAGYTIPEVVEDMEAARAALGYERIHLLSQSYGTRVAQIYAVMHPESVHRSAQIGVNPPGHFNAAPETADAQIEYYADLCRLDPECSSRTPDLAAAVRNVNQSMPDRWLFVPIDPGKAMGVSFILLMNRSTAPIVFDAYMAAEQGDPSGLAFLSLSYDFTLPGMMTWGEYFALGMSSDYEPGRDYRAELTAPDATFGSPVYLLIWGSASDHWPPVLMDDVYRQVQPSDVETLLISGTVDFSTPAQFAEQELLPSLRNGKHVIIAEQGHTSDFWNYQPEAAEHLLTSFYATGQADDSLYTYLPMDFKPSLRAPVLAKIFLAVGVLLIVLLGWAVWRIVRRIRQRAPVMMAASS